jgi:thiol-disulfide isomerase/thioredoxin
MKKIFLLAMLFGIVISDAYAQDMKGAAPEQKDSLAPYQKYPTLPAFNIGMMDSVSIFNTYNIPKGSPIAIFFFSPDCGHCKRTTKRIVDSMDMLKDVRFYMITPFHSMTELYNFYNEFHLDRYKNIQLVGRDNEFFFGSFYETKFVPDLALYDGQKKLIKLIQGETNVKAILEAVR